MQRTSPDDVRQRLIETEEADEEYAADLWERCGGKLDQLTAQMVAQAAGDGNEVAREVLAHACQALGWGIAQAITLVSPDVVVIGGGVSLMDESLFLDPVRREVDRYVFPPLADTYQIRASQTGRSGRRARSAGGGRGDRVLAVGQWLVAVHQWRVGAWRRKYV